MFGLGAGLLITAFIIGATWIRIETVFNEQKVPRSRHFAFLITYSALAVVAWALFYYTRRSII
jgi:hypothetical protein